MTGGISRRALIGAAAAGAGVLSVGAGGCRPAGAARASRRVPSVCRICTVSCGIECWVEGDRVVRVSGQQDSATQGFVCANGLALPELLASPRRLTRPMVRQGDRLRETSWQEALHVTGERLLAVVREHGPRAVAIQSGWALVYRNMVGWLKRLADAIGTPNYASSSSICVAASRMSSQLTFGRIGTADFNRTDLAIAWGWNPTHSSPPLANVLLRRQRTGTRLVVVDPCRTRLAARADVHLPLRPGSDLALALGLLGVVVRERLYDEAAVAEAVGFEELADAVSPLDPEWAAERTGLHGGEIEALARAIAASGTACGHTGVAVEQSPTGLAACRAVHALWAITGNVGRPGGWALLPRLGVEAERAARSLEPTPPAVTEPAVGAAEHPLFAELVGEAQGNLFPRAILEDDPYPVRALVVVGANPLLSGPDTPLTRRALERLDLLVVADPFMTETAAMAHVLLPSATFLESDDYVAMRNVGDVEAVVPPRGEAWPDWKIAFELARRVGRGRHFPWATGAEARAAQVEAMRRMPRPSGERFLTPSGRMELASARLREAGLPAVPSPVEREPAGEGFPLTLTTGARQPGFCNSQVRGVPMVEARVGPAVAEVGRATAAELGLEHGERVGLETEGGRLEIELYIRAGLRPGVVRIPHCMVEANANELSGLGDRDPATGFANLRAIPCRLRRSG